MKPIKNLLIFGVLFAMGTWAYAAEEAAAPPETPPGMDPAMMEKMKAMTSPNENNQALEPFAGNWNYSGSFWMKPDAPAQEMTGTAKNELIFDGRFLKQEFEGPWMGETFHGIGYTGYDNVKKQYQTVWIDSMGTGIFMMEGTASADGKTITLRGQHGEPGGGHMTHRAVWKLVDANTQTFEMYGAHGHGKELKMMEITYTRKQ